MAVKQVFRYKEIGLPRQVLTVNSSRSDTEWNYSSGPLLAVYSGTANVVLTNLPDYLHELRIVLATGGSQASHKLTNFVISSGTASTVQSSNFGVDHDTTFTTTTLDGATVGVSNLAHPSGAIYLGEDGSGHNVVDIRMPDFANASGANHTQRSIYSLSYSPPGTTSTEGFTVATTSYSLTDGSARITGFTIALNSVDTRVYVYGL